MNIPDLDPNKLRQQEMQIRAQISSGAAQIAQVLLSNPEFIKKYSLDNSDTLNLVYSFSMSLASNFNNFIFQEPKKILDS